MTTFLAQLEAFTEGFGALVADFHAFAEGHAAVREFDTQIHLLVRRCQMIPSHLTQRVANLDLSLCLILLKLRFV